MVDTNSYFQYRLIFIYIVNVAQCFLLGFSNVLFSLHAISLGFLGVGWGVFLLSFLFYKFSLKIPYVA